MEIKEIVEKLIENIADSKMEAGDILRNTKILAFNIDNASFKLWVDKESNGYNDKDILPAYRIIKTVLYGKIEQIKGFGNSLLYERFLLPASHLSSQEYDLINTWRCINSVGEVQSMIDNAGDNNLATPCPLSVIPLVKRVLSPNVNVNQVWRELQKYDLVNVIESVKNRLLDFLLELDKEMKLDANFIPSNNDMKTQMIFNNTINAGIANFGSNSINEIQDCNIAVNACSREVLDELIDIVKAIEKDKDSNNEDIKELLSDIKEEIKGGKKKSKLKAFVQALLSVATEVSANLITSYAQQALDLLQKN